MTMNRKARRRAAALARTIPARPEPATTQPTKRSTATSVHLRAALLGTVAAGTLITASPRLAAASGACSTDVAGITATCQGGQHPGLAFGIEFPYSTRKLEVNSLTNDIAPAAGRPGIDFQTTGSDDIEITSDTGAFKISTTGSGATGIQGSSRGSNGDFYGKYDTSGVGGSAGNVSITSTGNISTNGSSSIGISGQSLGGDGAFSKYDSGGAGGDGGNVSVTSSGNINTAGHGSDGIRATSQGGYGGQSSYTAHSYGGDGGSAGTVTVDSTGNITTTGDRSTGILAQSQGGYGGYDYYGSRGGDGGDVNVKSTGNIKTSGVGSHGISANSSGVSAGSVTISSTGNISTTKDTSTGIVGRSSGDGASVHITSAGDISTAGRNSYGIHGSSHESFGRRLFVGAAKIGPPGGLTISSTGDITTTGDYAHAIYGESGGDGNVSVTSNGNISTAGQGAAGIAVDKYGYGNVTVKSTGNVSTKGDGSAGIVAFTSGGFRLLRKVDGLAKPAPADGNVTVVSRGNITTSGRYSAGIAAGVFGGGDVKVTSIGNITARGQNSSGIFVAGHGAIDVKSVGNITTTGDGILVNTGGYYGRHLYGPTGSSDVAVENTGNIKATGADADGIFVYNRGNDSKISITNNAGGTIKGGSETGNGIDIRGGSANRITNFGGISTVGELAIRGGSGSETVNNFGIISGSIDLAAEDEFAEEETKIAAKDLEDIAVDTAPPPDVNAFNNRFGGIFNSGGIVNLGAGNLFTNSGTLSPGGLNNRQTTAITGNFEQTSSGVLVVDLDLRSGLADLVTVTGTAKVGGKVKLQVANVGSPELDGDVTILTAAGGVTDNGLGVISSPVLTAEVQFPNATDVVIRNAEVDFLLPNSPELLGGLNPNETGIAANLNAAFGAGSGGLSPIIDALVNGVSNLTEYKAALDQLSPEVYQSADTATEFGAIEFVNNLLSCRVNGNGYAFIREGQCAWFRIEGNKYERDTTPNDIGFEVDTSEIAGGAQIAIAPNWRLGFGVEYESSSLASQTGIESDGSGGSVGSVLKYQNGPLLLAAGVTTGIIDYKTTRQLSFGGFTATANSSSDLNYVGGRFRAAYLFPQNNWYAKPVIDLDWSRIDSSGFAETGGGAANLRVFGDANSYFSATPALELGMQFRMSDGTNARPYVKGGVAFHNTDSQSLTARFVNAPTGVGNFTVSTELDDVFADIEAGLTLLNDTGVTLTFGYEGRISDNTRQHGIYAKGSAEF